MDSISFYNPYLHGAKHKKKTSSQFLQILPRGLLKPGASGIINNFTDNEPRMFYDNKEFLLAKMTDWPTTSSSTDAVLERPCKVHIYDLVDTLMFTESIEHLPFQYRHHVIPSGNVIQMFGELPGGQSICVNVFGQMQYIYCECDEDIRLRSVISCIMAANPEINMPCSFYIERATKYCIYGYSTSCIPNLYKVTFSNSFIASKVGRCLQREGFKVYEIEVDFMTRFLVDNDFVSFGWYSINKFAVRDGGRSANTMYEIDCSIADIVCLPDETWPIYKCWSFDIECMSQDGGFPNPENIGDIVIQIAVISFLTEGDYRESHLFTLGSCARIEGVHVYEFASEYELLIGFLTFMKLSQPVFVTGYNISNFDFKYICTRMSRIYRMDIGKFTKLNRGKFYTHVPFEGHKKPFANSHTKVFISGVISIDMYPVYATKISAPNHKLDTVAKICLNKQKDDMPYKQIPIEFLSGPCGRQKVGKYCVQDADLVVDLFKRISYNVEIAEIARLAHITIRRAIFDGQQKRIFPCILREARDKGMIVPSLSSDRDQQSDESYKGATVLEPKVGYYAEPVVVFDFASLYPSIMMAHNLCYSTLLIEPMDRFDLSDSDVLTIDIDGKVYKFVKKSVRESLLGNLLFKWLSERKKVKSLMGSTTDTMMRLILDKKQLALKVTCNAVYGVTGAAAGILPCLAIAASVTCLGRRMLCDTTEYINKQMQTKEFFCKTFGMNMTDFEGDLHVRVIYGDTDSMFVLLENVCRSKLKELSESIAAHITSKLFVSPIKLEFEKVLCPLMMICKKRYIGSSEDGTLVLKGVELVRKTSCTFVKNAVKAVVDLLFWDDDVRRAAVKLSGMSVKEVHQFGVPEGMYKIINSLCSARDALFMGNVHISDMVLSTVLSRDICAYKQQNLPHLHVIKRMASRREELPSVGDRVQYVLVAPPEGHNKLPNYELAEDPNYVMEKNIPIHAEKYFDHIVKAVTNVISPIFPKDVKKEKFLLTILPIRVYLDPSFKDIVEVL